jgi:hypothetical protein
MSTELIVLLLGILGAQAIVWAALSLRMNRMKREIERLARMQRDQNVERASIVAAAPSSEHQQEKLTSGAGVFGAAVVIGGVILESTCSGHLGVAVLTVGLCVELGLALAKFCTDLATPAPIAITRRR